MKKPLKLMAAAILIPALSVLPSVSDCGILSNIAGPETVSAASSLSELDMSAWSYESSADVYYQTGLVYCSTPVDTNYETLGIFVPGAYMTGTANGDGTYTCKVNASGTKGDYTAETAPIVMPVNTPGYSAMKPPTGYSKSVSTYTDGGMIYLYAGCRGRDSGAPAGVTDLKAAIRYYRCFASSGSLPGDADSVFTFGHSGGGAQSSLLGATGDSPLYDDYLAEIGALAGYSDAVKGSMCWCPITNLDVADGAYEWNMGSSRSGLSSDDQAVSDGLAESFAKYINDIAFTDENGTVLTLASSEDGIYQSGTYYDYILSVIETSLNNYLSDTYGSSTSEAASYIDELNSKAGKDWVTYDSSTNTASVSSVSDFASAIKNASKELGAFDNITKKSSAENQLFGQDGSYSHFDSVLMELIKDNATYSSEYNTFSSEISATDSQGLTVTERLNLYNPVYYLNDYYDGYNTSNVADFWRIRTGITQGDTALCTEVDLALALQNYSSDINVDFATVWGKGHTEAERTGSASENFIEWVNECMASEPAPDTGNKITVPTGKTLTYNGSEQTGVESGTGYTLSGTVSATDAGSYTATATLNDPANYTWKDGTTEDKTITWTIQKASNTLTVTGKTAKVKYTKLASKNVKLKAAKVMTVEGGEGDITYTKVSGNKKISINSTTGKITVKKGLKKGTYKVTVAVQAAGDSNYNASEAKTVTFKIKVK